MLALLRQPRWAGFAVLTVVMCVLFWWLGTWQWGRHIARAERNDAIRLASEQTAAPLTNVVTDPEAVSDSATYRLATASGTYLADQQVLQRNPLGRSGFEVITPLALAGGGTLLVNRGWISTSPTDPNGASADVSAPAGPVGVTVSMRAPQDDSGRRAPAGQIYDIDPAQLSGDLPAPVYVMYGDLIEQDPSADTVIELPPPPETGIGVHLFYAIQWWLFIGIALAGYVILLRRESRTSLTGTDTHQPAAVRQPDQAYPLN